MVHKCRTLLHFHVSLAHNHQNMFAVCHFSHGRVLYSVNVRITSFFVLLFYIPTCVICLNGRTHASTHTRRAFQQVAESTEFTRHVRVNVRAHTGLYEDCRVTSTPIFFSQLTRPCIHTHVHTQAIQDSTQQSSAELTGATWRESVRHSVLLVQVTVPECAFIYSRDPMFAWRKAVDCLL